MNTSYTEDAVNITDSPRHATISESTESNRRARVSRTSGLPPGQYYRHRHRGAVAQLGEHLNGIEGVGGSSPPSSTIFRPCLTVGSTDSNSSPVTQSVDLCSDWTCTDNGAAPRPHKLFMLDRYSILDTTKIIAKFMCCVERGAKQGKIKRHGSPLNST